MRLKVATVATVFTLVVLLANHWWVGVQVARLTPPGPPNDFGVALPGYLRSLVKLDHLAVTYGYVLIPLVWVATFGVASAAAGLQDLLGGPKAPGDGPA